MTRVRWAALAPLAVVLAAAAGCGRSSAGGEATSCTDSKTGSGVTVALTTTPCPPKGGLAAKAHITVKDSAGTAVKDATVKVTTDMPAMNMHGGDLKADPNGDGYETNIVLGMGGDWDVKVDVQRPSATPAAVTFTLTAK